MKKKTTIILALMLVVCMGLMASCGGGSNTDYMSWTADDWKAASDEDKTAAMKEVLVEVQPELKDQGDNLDTYAGAMIPSIDAMFEASPDTTLGDLTKQAQDAMNAAQEAATTGGAAED